TVKSAAPPTASGFPFDVVGQWPNDLNGNAYDLALSGPYAFLADGPAGMQVIDISDVRNPHRVSRYTTGDQVVGIALTNHLTWLGPKTSAVIRCLRAVIASLHSRPMTAPSLLARIPAGK